MRKGKVDWRICDIAMCKANKNRCYKNVFNFGNELEFRETTPCASFVLTDIHYILADLNMPSIECRRIIVHLVGIILVSKISSETFMTRINSLLCDDDKSAESIVCKLRRNLRELFDRPETLVKFEEIFGIQYTADTCSPKAFLDQLTIAYEIAFSGQNKRYADQRISKK